MADDNNTNLVVSWQTFIIDFPEFKNVDRVFVERKLLQAEDDTPYNIWLSKRNRGIMLKAAHEISMAFHLWIGPMLGYMMLKEIEMHNIRTIFVAKDLMLTGDQIYEYLVTSNS